MGETDLERALRLVRELRLDVARLRLKIEHDARQPAVRA